MNIISPKTAWRDYDRTQMDLSAAVISEKVSGTERIIRAYFNGMSAEGGVARVFAKVAIPLDVVKPPVLLLMRDAEHSVDSTSTAIFTSRGYAVVVVDYAGYRDDSPFYTMYPESLKMADFVPGLLTAPPADPLENCWIVWAKVMLRAVTYIESFDLLDTSRIIAIGEGVASANVWKTCAVEEKLLAGVSVFGSRFAPEYSEEDIMDEAFLSYEAALMKASYAPFLKTPILIMAASNDRDDSIDRISEAYLIIAKPNGSRLSISERTHRSIGFKQKDNIWLWLEHYFENKGSIPKEPQLSANCSEQKLYYNIKADPDSEVELFVSQGMERGSLRNWHSEKIVQTGDGEYICRQEVYDINKPIYAFVNISKNGFSVSSPLLEKLPSGMGVAATPVKPSRLVYDSEMGVDDWTAYSESSRAQAVMMNGPFGIEGVTANGGALVTYKLAEMKYSGEGSDILQVSLCSTAPQKVNLFITVKRTVLGEARFIEYEAEFQVYPEDNWRKLNLMPSDFVSDLGVAASWADVVSLRIESENQIAIKSVLWV